MSRCQTHRHSATHTHTRWHASRPSSSAQLKFSLIPSLPRPEDEMSITSSKSYKITTNKKKNRLIFFRRIVLARRNDKAARCCCITRSQVVALLLLEGRTKDDVGGAGVWGNVGECGARRDASLETKHLFELRHRAITRGYGSLLWGPSTPAPDSNRPFVTGRSVRGVTTALHRVDGAPRAPHY